MITFKSNEPSPDMIGDITIVQIIPREGYRTEELDPGGMLKVVGLLVGYQITKENTYLSFKHMPPAVINHDHFLAEYYTLHDHS